MRCVRAAPAPSSAPYVLGGGEDFELIVAVQRHAFAHFAARFDALGRPLVAVGHFTEGSAVQMQNADGKLVHVPHSGWDHLRG